MTSSSEHVSCVTGQREKRNTARHHPPNSIARIGRPNRHTESLHTVSAERRHTTLTWVERNFGYAVARAYAGHADGGSETGVTATYVRASTHEVAAALAALTEEPHPLATQEGW